MPAETPPAFFFRTGTEQVLVISGRDASLSVHYVGTSLGAVQGTSNCLCPECHFGKSGRRELISRNYAAHTSHPFSCSSQCGVCSGQSSHPFSCSLPTVLLEDPYIDVPLGILLDVREH